MPKILAGEVVLNLSHWNYRVVSCDQGYYISEVWYDDKLNIVGHTGRDYDVVGGLHEDATEIEGNLTLVSQAFEKPILTEDGDTLRELT